MTEPLLDAGALEGVRVLELGTAIVSGPTARRTSPTSGRRW